MKTKPLLLLLDQKKKAVEKAALECADLESKRAKILSQIETMEDYFKSLKRKAEIKFSSSVFGDEIRHQLGFREKIEEGIIQQRSRLEIISRNLESARNTWNESIIECKKVEKLVSKNEKILKNIEAKKDQKLMDEYAIRFACRQLNISR